MVEDSKQICRTCLNKSTKTVWLGADHIVCENVIPVSQLLMECSSIKIKVGDDLPQYVCTNCIHLAEESYNFRIKCKKNDDVFKHITHTSLDIKIYVCPLCSSEFKSVKGLLDHLYDHEDNDLIYECVHCPIRFPSEDTLTDHCKTHLKNFISDLARTHNYRCELCVEIYTGIYTLQKHLSSHTYNILETTKFEDPCDTYQEQNFECSVCNEQFNSDVEMQLHKTKHSIKTESDTNDESPIKCPECSLSFESLAALQTHSKTHVKKTVIDIMKNNFTCKYCSKTFRSLTNYNKHLKTHRNKSAEHTSARKRYECELCSIHFSNFEELKMHKKKHIKYRCNKCKLTFDNIEQLKKHTIEHLRKAENMETRDASSELDDNDASDFRGEKCNSESKMSYSCKLCSSKFYDFEDIKNHLGTHGVETRDLFKNLCYKCDECAKEFITIYEFFKHKLNETVQLISLGATERRNVKRKRIYPCSRCPKKFPAPSALKKHERSHNNTWPRSCTYCSEIVTSLQNFMQHCNQKHEDNKNFACDTCGKKFFAMRNLQTHKKTHSEKKHMCDICGHSFQAYNNMLSHRRLHTGDKPYKCEYCSKAFAQHASWRSHLLNHTKERKYQCPYCDKTFQRSGTLSAHKKTHTGVKNYKCEICEKKFTASSTKKKHMLTHTGERNFVCDICNKAFGRKSNLTVHRKIHTGERPNVCEICGKGFLQAHVLRSHMNTHRKHMQQQVVLPATSSLE